jgi:hypothetical protein
MPRGVDRRWSASVASPSAAGHPAGDEAPGPQAAGRYGYGTTAPRMRGRRRTRYGVRSMEGQLPVYQSDPNSRETTGAPRCSPRIFTRARWSTASSRSATRSRALPERHHPGRNRTSRPFGASSKARLTATARRDGLAALADRLRPSYGMYEYACHEGNSSTCSAAPGATSVQPCPGNSRECFIVPGAMTGSRATARLRLIAAN